MPKRLCMAGLASGAALLAFPVLAQDIPDLSALSLEELARVDIVSVSRRPEPLSRAAAAIYVITAEDIRRSGAASLPEVLRLAPNLQVQRVSAADYAISARGFNGFETANKMLVMIDGRSIYTSLFSGVLWDAQGLLLEDIERIEVISGPGGTLHGANAVNAVVSITTRSAFETGGAAVAADVGNEDRRLAVRYGWTESEWAGRIYAQGFERDESFLPAGGNAGDAFTGLRAGGRLEWRGTRDEAMLSAEVYKHQVDPDNDMDGGFLLGRWVRSLQSGGALEAQGFFDRTSRVLPSSDETVETSDLAFQHVMAQRGRHRVVWGGGYRQIDNALHAPPAVPARLDPAQRNITLANLFAQDQIDLRDDLVLTLGAKFEENSFSDEEFLPSVRLAWTTPSGALVWGAVSRAARTPSRIDRDLVLPGFLTQGEFDSEILTAYELGARITPSSRTSLSINVYYHDYGGIRTVDFEGPLGQLPVRFENGANGETWGIEIWGAFQARPGWRISGGLSTLDKDFRLNPGQFDITQIVSQGFDPEYQVLLVSQANLTDRLEFDIHLRAVGELPDTVIENYVETKVRLGWRVSDDLVVEAVGENLINDRRLETQDPDRRRAFGPSFHVGVRAGF